MKEALSQSDRVDYILASNENGKSCQVPSPGTLRGYAIFDPKKEDYQILFEFKKAVDNRQVAIWEKIQSGNGQSIFPQVIDCGIDGGGPFHITALPDGVPLLDYMLNCAPWPAKMVAKMLAQFAWELTNQTAVVLDQYAISYESIWIEQTIYGPRLFLGNLGLSYQEQAMCDNQGMLLSIFRDLVKDEGDNRAINRLIRESRKETTDLTKLEELLVEFSREGNGIATVWQAQNEPTSYFQDYPFPKIHFETETEDDTHTDCPVDGPDKQIVLHSSIEDKPDIDDSKRSMDSSSKKSFWTRGKKITTSVLLIGAAGIFFATAIVWTYHQLSWEAKSQLHYQLESSEFYHNVQTQLKK